MMSTFTGQRQFTTVHASGHIGRHTTGGAGVTMHMILFITIRMIHIMVIHSRATSWESMIHFGIHGTTTIGIIITITIIHGIITRGAIRVGVDMSHQNQLKSATSRDVNILVAHQIHRENLLRAAGI